MQIEIKVPVMGESISEATVSALLAPNGSYVSSGQEIIELETDKVNQVLYAPESGEVTFTVSVGDTIKVGEKIGFLAKGIGKAPPKKEEKKEEKPSLTQEGGVRQREKDFVKGLEEKIEVKKPVKKGSKTRKKMSVL